MENWLGSSLNQIQGWTTVQESYSRALVQGLLIPTEITKRIVLVERFLRPAVWQCWKTSGHTRRRRRRSIGPIKPRIERRRRGGEKAQEVGHACAACSRRKTGLQTGFPYPFWQQGGNGLGREVEVACSKSTCSAFAAEKNR